MVETLCGTDGFRDRYINAMHACSPVVFFVEWYMGSSICVFLGIRDQDFSIGIGFTAAHYFWDSGISIERKFGIRDQILVEKTGLQVKHIPCQDPATLQ